MHGTMRTWAAAALAVAVTAGLTALLAGNRPAGAQSTPAQESAQPQRGVTVGSTIKKPPAEPLGASGDSSKWTATTYEAATTEEHRKVLASGTRARVTGEVIDVSCYLQLGKHGAGHEACATKCATNGQPIGLLTAEGTLFFLFPEEHHPRRDGQAEIRTALIPRMGKTVTLAGTETQVRGSRGLFLRAADLAGLEPAPTGSDATQRPARER